jgi:hypothetical protein
MNGFEADPALLRAAASRLGTLVRASADRPALGYAAHSALAGDVLLGAALEHLQQTSSAAVKILLADAGGLGERLETAAGLYAECQDQVQDRLERIARLLDGSAPGSEPGTPG